MWQNILLFALTFVLCTIAVFSIKYTPIRKAETFGDSVRVFFRSTKLDFACFVLIYLSTFAALAMLVFFYKENTAVFIAKRIIIMSVLWTAAYFDKKSFRIPNKLILLGLAYRIIVLMFEIVYAREGLAYQLISEGIAAVMLLVAALLSMLIVKNGLGMGDAKLFIIIGLFLGTQGAVLAIFLSLIIMFFISLILMIRKKKTKKDGLPFAPAILCGTMLAISILGA